MLKALREGETLVVVKLDRLARTMKHLIELKEAIQEKGAALCVLDGGVDIGTPVGRLTFHIIEGLTDFKLALIRERMQAGLRAVRERGRRGGRKKKLEGKALDLAQAQWGNLEFSFLDFSVEDVAAQMKVSRRTLFCEIGARPIPAPSL